MNPSILYKAKKRGHPTQKEYLAWAEVLDWFTRELMTLIFYGRLIRDGRTERVLKKFREKSSLRAIWYDGRWAYSAKRINRRPYDQIPDHIYHGLGCSEGLVRFYLSDHGAIIIPARRFLNLGYRPEWGMMLSSGMTLLYEFCTADNVRRRLKHKIQTYMGLPENQAVLFVLDIAREHLSTVISGPYFFVDYESFKKVPYGEQLTAPIYTWGDSGKILSMRPI
jgi:hypothetical protein